MVVHSRLYFIQQSPLLRTWCCTLCGTRSPKSTWIPRFLATRSPQLMQGAQRREIVASLQAQRTSYQRHTVSPQISSPKNIRHYKQRSFKRRYWWWILWIPEASSSGIQTRCYAITDINDLVYPLELIPDLVQATSPSTWLPRDSILHHGNLKAISIS